MVEVGLQQLLRSESAVGETQSYSTHHVYRETERPSAAGLMKCPPPALKGNFPQIQGEKGQAEYPEHLLHLVGCVDQGQSQAALSPEPQHPACPCSS